MGKVRRSLYAFFYLEDDRLRDIASLLSGKDQRKREARALGLALLTGQRHPLEREELELLLSVPADGWIDADGLDEDVLRSLIAKGLLLSDGNEPGVTTLRAREDSLLENEWNLYAAVYHYMTQWSGVDSPDAGEDAAGLYARSRAAARSVVEQYGPPPEAIREVKSSKQVRLPAVERNSELYQTLTARRTTRAFAVDTPMTIEQLDTVLLYVFGCHGYARNAADVVCIKRTSPSGGGLHPIDVYPIVSNVSGVDPGVYYYNAGSHSLAKLRELPPDEGRRMATSLMSGQSFFGSAHVSFILTARFYRNHWKYRRHQKAYAGILMDAAHLSQTLYLVSAQLGLGAFLTIAINGRDIEDQLGLDGVSAGAIAMSGCGPRAQGDCPLELSFSPARPD